MNCRAAAREMVRYLTGAAAQSGDTFEEHLRTCLGCRDRFAAYDRVRRAVRELTPSRLPEDFRPFLDKAVEEALVSRVAIPELLADPQPERGRWRRVLVGLTALAALITAGLLILGLTVGGHKPAPPAGRILLSAGDVEMSPPGRSNWQPLGIEEDLASGTRLRMGEGALLKVQTAGGELWLAGVGGLGLAGPAQAELRVGRLYGRWDGAAAEPVRLVTGAGSLACTKGEFVATASMRHVRVACVSGSVSLTGEGAGIELAAGQEAMLVEGKPPGPVRSVRPAEVTHWLKLFERYGQSRLSARQLASVRLVPDRPLLPDGVSVEALRIGLQMRGPLAFLAVDVQIRNDGDAAWSGTLRPSQLVLPLPLAETTSGMLELSPGGTAACKVAAVCLLDNRDDRYAVGLNPEVWTAGRIGQVEVRVDATAEGGVRQFDCPSLDKTAKRVDRVDWSWSAREFNPHTPMLFELKCAARDGVDSLALVAEGKPWVLTAWRPAPRAEAWIRPGRSIVFAFDATADFGPGGRAYAQEVMEALLGFVPSGCRTALFAYDGKVMADRDPLMAHLPARAAALAEGLWNITPQAEEAGGGFLRTAVALTEAAGPDSLLIYVTGSGPEAGCPAPGDEAPQANTRVAILRLGADDVPASCRSFAARSGGVALGLSPSMPPDAAALSLLANLDRPAVKDASVRVDGSAKAALVPAGGSFANQPIAALIEMATEGDGAAGRFLAHAGGEELRREFRIGWPSTPACDEQTAAALIEALKKVPAQR